MAKALNLNEMGALAKDASRIMARTETKQKDLALFKIAQGLQENSETILKANLQDVKDAEKAGMPEAFLDRLNLKGRLEGMSDDVLKVRSLADPVNEDFDSKVLPNGLHLSKKRTPIGVLGVIYESRPNVTIDVAALTLKTGNCAILRGGKETVRTNLELLKIIQDALKSAELPQNAIQLISSKERADMLELLKLHKYVDLIIPRGGEGLHQFCRENSTIPVITGGMGICHLFVDESAHFEQSLEVIRNAKIQRPSACNALDTVLVHASIAKPVIEQIVETLGKDGVTFKLDPKALKLMGKGHQALLKAEEKDWDTEWLGLTLGIKVVESLEEAIDHIQKHSCGHSDGILTQNNKNADKFIHDVDSAAVYVNASTRFTDGGQFGLGAEVAISTQKLHARGPMGLKELTSYKWVVQGNYQTRK